jgi:hypothetical protein
LFDGFAIQEIKIIMSMFNRIVLTFIGAAIALSVSRAANALVCSGRNLKGSFGYTVTGNIVTDIPASPAGPTVLLSCQGTGQVIGVRETIGLSAGLLRAVRDPAQLIEGGKAGH